MAFMIKSLLSHDRIDVCELLYPDDELVKELIELDDRPKVFLEGPKNK